MEKQTVKMTKFYLIGAVKLHLQFPYMNRETEAFYNHHRSDTVFECISCDHLLIFSHVRYVVIFHCFALRGTKTTEDFKGIR